MSCGPREQDLLDATSQRRGTVTTKPADDIAITLDTGTKPSSRNRDRGSMPFAIDLRPYNGVRHHGNAIQSRLPSGMMPCDGACRRAQVETFQPSV
jgi:hypothetical protein